MTTAKTTYRAYRTQAAGITSIVIATKRSIATKVTMDSATECGWYVGWTDIRTTRAPEFDHLAHPLPCSREYPRNRPTCPGAARKPCDCSRCWAR